MEEMLQPVCRGEITIPPKYFTGIVPKKPITISELKLLTQEERENLPVIYFIDGEEVSKTIFDRYLKLKAFW